MSRATAVGLPIGAPIVRQLPAIYQDDAFIAEFTSGLDVVLAPVVSTLDSLSAYVDPTVAPSDFVNWLASWIGIPLDEDWSLDRRRVLVSAAVELYGRRGTAHGLRDEVALYTEGAVHIDEPGRTIVATTPGSVSAEGSGGVWGAPGTQVDDARVVRVTVDVTDEASVNWEGLQAVVRDAVPAHLAVEIELRERVIGDEEVDDGTATT